MSNTIETQKGHWICEQCGFDIHMEYRDTPYGAMDYEEGHDERCKNW